MLIAAVNHDIKSLNSKDLPPDNLMKPEREVLLNLHKRNDIIIRKADKRGAVDYIDEVDTQLNDTNHYEQLDFVLKR